MASTRPIMARERKSMMGSPSSLLKTPRSSTSSPKASTTLLRCTFAECSNALTKSFMNHHPRELGNYHHNALEAHLLHNL